MISPAHISDLISAYVVIVRYRDSSRSALNLDDPASRPLGRAYAAIAIGLNRARASSNCGKEMGTFYISKELTN